MAVNRKRGEVSATIDGEERRLCLTLGALAELEDAFAADNLGELADRFRGGRLSARDLTRIIGAGLRGAGAEVSDAEVGAMHIDGGAAGAAATAVELLAAAFGSDQEVAGTGAANPREAAL
ncbi:gene transfer agent family protein [Jiella mangrovi]|uniref:gene transfer agent family protein n=1 Tax=Jiella mangrovi TaxID=2821407 RepID=UPI001FD72FEE|nr:gene transfer agent family protein [Jiella mangrovi]